MTKRFDPRLIAASLAVSAVALTGAAQAQQGQTQGQQNQQKQQSEQSQQSQQQARQQQTPPQARSGQQQMRQSPMEYRQIRGTIIDARRVPVRGSKQPATLVLLQTEQGNRAVVDLGTERLGISLRHGSELAVRGRPVMVGRQRVILQANAVSYEGRAFDVNRPAMMQSGATDQRRDRQAQKPGGQGNP